MLLEYWSWGVTLAEPEEPRGAMGLAATRVAEAAARTAVNLANILAVWFWCLVKSLVKKLLYWLNGIVGDWLDLLSQRTAERIKEWTSELLCKRTDLRSRSVFGDGQPRE